MTEPLPADDASSIAEGDPPSEGWFFWLRSQGAATQAVVPGIYAWAVTMAPLAWARGATVVAEGAAAMGLLCLVLGPVLERRWPELARLGVGWGLVLSALATWASTTEPVLGSFDAARSIAGMFGWALFAFAIASPIRRPGGAVARPEALAPRAGRKRLDTPLLLLAVGLVVALEIPGWHIESRDRMVLLRVVALAGGLGTVTAATTIAVEHHRPAKAKRGARSRMIRASVVAWVGSALLLLGAGVAYEVWGSS